MQDKTYLPDPYFDGYMYGCRTGKILQQYNADENQINKGIIIIAGVLGAVSIGLTVDFRTYMQPVLISHPAEIV